MPRAKPAQTGLDDNQPTLEAQWEDEASTTVEEGDAGERIRALVGNAGAPAMTPTTPDTNGARLLITQGSDLGREISIRIGKTYTIGRGLDNDFVLTDIAVSRKHFDLRAEGGSWIIADRGSGNGTVVNGNVEDAPFTLMTGDTIEIGNTAFRFEQANGAARELAVFDDEQDELSTVAGKHRPIEVATPLEAPPPRLEMPRERPKTAPPQNQMRHPGAVPIYPPPLAPPPSTTMPMTPMANRAPVLGPQQSTMLVDSDAFPPLGGTTIPGQVPARASYPVHIAAQQPRFDPSTAHVQPPPYHAMPPGMQLRQYAPPQLTRRSKMLIAAAGISTLAAILTIALLKAGGSKAVAKPNPAAASGSSASENLSAKVATPIKPPPPKHELAKTAPATPPKQDPPKQDPPKQDPPKQDPPKQDPPKQDPPKIAQVTPPKQDPPKKDPPKDTSHQASARQKATTPDSTPTKRVATADIEGTYSKADEAYRAKRFSDAANIMAAAAHGAPEDEAKKLRHKADLYESFRKAYNVGTAPGTKPVEAFDRLQKAVGYDNALGRAFDSELNTKLAQVAPKAAASYLGQKDYKNAHLAVMKAEAFGGANDTTKLVKQTLESKAGDFYNQAKGEADSNADDAREKCRQVLDMVDPSSNYGAKAKKLLAQLAK